MNSLTSEESLSTMGHISLAHLEEVVSNALSTMTLTPVLELTSMLTYSTVSHAGYLEIQFKLSPDRKV